MSDLTEFQNDYNAMGIVQNSDTMTINNAAAEGYLSNLVNQTVDPTSMTSGQTINQLTCANGYIQSGNFKTGSLGWQITSDGNCEFNNGVFRGLLQAATIENGAGTVVIDSFGLNSSANFKHDSIYYSTPQNTSSGSYSDISGTTMNSFTLSRTAVVSINYKIYGLNDRYVSSSGQKFSTAYGQIQLVDSEDGVLETGIAFTGIPAVLFDSHGNPSSWDIASQWVGGTLTVLMSANTHTLKLQYRSHNEGGNTYIYIAAINYSILGI